MPWQRHGVQWTLLACACLLTVPLAAQPGDVAAREAQINSRLNLVRDQQRELTLAREEVRGERKLASVQLREAETLIGVLLREISRIEQQIVEHGARIASLSDERDQLRARLRQQRNEVATLLRSAYAAGHHERLRIVFAPEHLGRIQRALAYHRFLQRDRLVRIRALDFDLQALAAVYAEIESSRLSLQAARDGRQQQIAALDLARAARAQALSDLDARLADQASQIAALGKDERGLLELLGRLRDAIGDVPRLLDGAQPFASLRGRVPWPIKGKVLESFGTLGAGGRSIEGVLIEADAGAAVQVVSHGRVAFADWMAGYGLLLIVDHGDGYMSLYAHNDALLADVGEWVDAGETIARAGASGGRSAPGLYFELRARGRPVDPVSWLARR